MYQYRKINSMVSTKSKKTLRKIYLSSIISRTFSLLSVIVLSIIAIGLLISFLFMYKLCYLYIGEIILAVCTGIVVLFASIVIIEIYLYNSLTKGSVEELNKELKQHILEFDSLGIKHTYKQNDLYYTIKLYCLDRECTSICPKIWESSPHVCYVFRRCNYSYKLDLDFFTEGVVSH